MESKSIGIFYGIMKGILSNQHKPLKASPQVHIEVRHSVGQTPYKPTAKPS
jgi:hypothetical protein